MELNDDDLFVVEEPQSSSRIVPASPRNAEQAVTMQRPQRSSRPALPAGSRRVVDEDVEEDVAGQCLASIAAETSRDSYSSSHVRAAIARPASAPALLPPAPAPAPSAPPSSVSRLPAVSAPPFLRTTSVRRHAYGHGHAQAPGVRDAAPPSAFVRRSSPVILPPTASSSPVGAPSSVSSVALASERNASSVAPVSMSQLGAARQEPTVILVREPGMRGRAVWMLAAAALGAFGAIAATRLLGAAEERASAPVAAAVQPSPAPPPAAVVLPVTPLVAPVVAPAPASPAPTAAVVSFGEDQGVAIKAPARSPAPVRSSFAPSPRSVGAPAVRPAPARAPSIGPALPDGSFGLSRADAPQATPATPAVPVAQALLGQAPTAEPAPARKRALTPEQQLAEAQLKASMR